MQSILSIKAHEWSQKSFDSVKEKKYFKSWIQSIPARIYYLADVIVNVCLHIFLLLKIPFEFLKSIYTWGDETTSFKKTFENLSDNVLNIINSFFGIFFISYNSKEKLPKNIRIILHGCGAALVFFVGLNILFPNVLKSYSH